eukprot:8124922-Alexandrium_andersonii.AAC.1
MTAVWTVGVAPTQKRQPCACGHGSPGPPRARGLGDGGPRTVPARLRSRKAARAYPTWHSRRPAEVAAVAALVGFPDAAQTCLWQPLAGWLDARTAQPLRTPRPAAT